MRVRIHKLEYLGAIRAASLDEIVEKYWEDILAVVSWQAGSLTRLMPTRVWADYEDTKGSAYLHVMCAGRKFNLYLNGIDERDLPEAHEFDIRKAIAPYDPYHPNDDNDVMETVGILEGAVDFLCDHYGVAQGHPCWTLHYQYPDLIRTRFAVFHNQVMLGFQKELVRKKRGLEKIFGLIDEANRKLIEVDEIPARKVGADKVYYYRTIEALNRQSTRSELYRYRRKLGMTQTDLAKELGVSLRQLQRYETDDCALANAPVAVVEKLAAILGADITDLVKDGKLVYERNGENS